MLSGNGRHRRPRQAPALLVAAGVTGSAIAIPLLGATGASAAEGSTWDKVAECESGGSWSADDGNGYYGGLQVTQENWEAYGGKAYAASPDQASRSQQIAVAERILADQGLAAWPTCGPLSGLDADSGSVGIDTGLEEDSNSSDSSESSNSSGSAGLLDTIGGGTSTDDETEAEADASASASPGASGESKGSKGSKGSNGSTDSADSANADKSGKSNKANNSDKTAESSQTSEVEASEGSSGSSGSASSGVTEGLFTGISGLDNSDNILWVGGNSTLMDTGAGRHRGQPADEGGAERTYVVREGDTLGSIADSLDLDGGWRGLYADNRSAIGSDPSRITPGQTLEVGDESVGNQG
ncbi:transglycosylase family protein [Streptomyces sp. NPDC003832]